MNELVIFGIIVGLAGGFPTGLLLGRIWGTITILRIWEEIETRKNEEASKISGSENNGRNN